MLRDVIALGPVEIARRVVKWVLFYVLCRRSLARYYALRSRVITELANRNLYESAELHFLKKCVPVAGVAIDVGANFGVYTTRLSDLVGPNGRVLAFEPLGRVYDALVETVKPYPQVSHFKQGISDQSAGEVEFKIPLLFGEIPEPALATVGDSASMKCLIEKAEIIHLDSLLSQLSRLDFVKIDVEGHELQCLNGARGLLTTHRPIVQFEENEPVMRMHLFEKFAEENDYRVCTLSSQGALSPIRTAHRIEETHNFYLLPCERAEEFEPTRAKR
jgi:FkbM family methyltransferase